MALTYHDDDSSLDADDNIDNIGAIDSSDMPIVELESNEQELFDPKLFDCEEIVARQSPYINNLYNLSKLKVLKEKEACHTFKKYGPGGLVRLFLRTVSSNHSDVG